MVNAWIKSSPDGSFSKSAHLSPVAGETIWMSSTAAIFLRRWIRALRAENFWVSALRFHSARRLVSITFVLSIARLPLARIFSWMVEDSCCSFVSLFLTLASIWIARFFLLSFQTCSFHLLFSSCSGTVPSCDSSISSDASANTSIVIASSRGWLVGIS